MTGTVWHKLRGALALALCAMLLCQGAFVLAEESGAIDPPPTVTESAATDAPAPTDTETATPTGTDATVTPDSAATPETSATPEASETPAATDTPPVCDIEGCAHLGYDADGKLVALCPLGEWMLAHGVGLPEATDAAPMMALFAAPAPGPVTLIDGTTTLYRSGTYILSGGSSLSKVVVSDNLAVALILQNATIGELTLGGGVSLEMSFTGLNAIDKMHAGSGEITFDGTGSLLVSAMDDLGTARLTMRGGSIGLPSGAGSQNGRILFECDATGATSATVDGASFPFTTPDYTGQAHLWLPVLGGGATYRGSVLGGVLAVQSHDPDPSVTGSFDMDGAAEYTAVADTSTSVISSGGVPQYHKLTIDQSGVSLVFSNILLGSSADVTLSRAARIHVNGACSAGNLTGAATATVTGSGALALDSLATDALRCVGGVRITYGTAGGSWQSGWQQLTSPIDLSTVTSLTYNGKTYAIASAAGEPATLYAPLPAPASGMKYDVRASGTALTAIQIPVGTQTLTLGNSGLNITAGGNYVIETDGTTSGSITVADGITATLILRSVRTGGALSVGADASATLALEGGSQFGGGLTLGAGSTFAAGGTGALLLASVADGGASISVGSYTNVSLSSGATLGGSSLKPTVISVTDASLAPLANAAVTLRIGAGTPFRTTTAANGLVTLWGSRSVTKASVVVLSQANTYAEILTGVAANPDALPEISAVSSHTAGYVTFTTTGAQTAGIQVYVNRAGVAMPDTFVSDAAQVPRLYGECNIPGLKAGDVVTYRAYAARQAGQSLTADTADGFQFSEQFTFTVTAPRKAFTLANQSKEYDQAAFRFRSGQIPSGATVTWYRGTTLLGSAPRDVGEYTAVVDIPTGNAEYMPGVTYVGVSITRKVVWIYPEPAYKIKGEKDPDFYYTYSDMFGSDEVTGPLGRYQGERVGNYPYFTQWLVAPDCYELRIDPLSPMFFIDWGPGHYIKVDPLSIIDPVHQIIEFSDGRKLDLILRTGNRMNISGMGYGEMVIDTNDRRARPFTPQLRLKHGYDQAMVLVEAEPEINPDGGYATDADGKLLLNPRTLSLSGYHLSHFKAQRITALGFRLQGVLVTLDLEDLQTDAVRQAMADAGLSQLGVRYQITLAPVARVSDLADYPDEAQTDKALGAAMMNIRIEAVSGGQAVDIAKLIPSARTSFDASEYLSGAADTTPEITEMVVGKPQANAVDENALTTDTMELMLRIMQERLRALGVALKYYEGGAQTLDSQLVVPYTASETEALPYTAIMQTSPFLMVRHLQNGLYGLASAVAP